MTNIIKFEEQKKDLDYLKDLASIAAKSGNYAGMSEVTLLNLMLSAKDLGVSPMKALNGGFYVVNGKVCMSTALMADRIRKAGHNVKITEWTDQKCVMLGIRRDNGDSVKLEFNMDDATRAGLGSSPTWKKFPKNMLYNRAMSTLARVLFSDVIGNSYSEEERFEIQNVPPEKRPLENADSDIVVADIIEKEEPEVINDEQLEKIERFLQSYPEKKEKIMKFANVNALEKMNPSVFEKVSNIIDSHLKKEGVA
jgi:hypothetical protein